MGTGISLTFVQIAVQSLHDDVADERAFAAAADAGDTDKGAERNFDVDVFQIVVRRAENLQVVAVSFAAGFRNGDLLFTRQKLAREALLILDHFARRALNDQIAAADARAGAEV